MARWKPKLLTKKDAPAVVSSGGSSGIHPGNKELLQRSCEHKKLEIELEPIAHAKVLKHDVLCKLQTFQF